MMPTSNERSSNSVLWFRESEHGRPTLVPAASASLPGELPGRRVEPDRSNEVPIALEELRIAAVVFEAQQGIVITDAQGIIIRVNRAFTRLTGYSPAEVIGRTPAMLGSGHQGSAFYQRMWQVLKETGAWQGEISNRHKDGRIYVKSLTIAAVLTPEGVATHYVGAFSGISENQQAETDIDHLAGHDRLTHLPDRCLVDDRVAQALAASGRSLRRGAVLFIDLDHFGNLNDAYGHRIGDQLLVEAARRLLDSVREGDTVARPGGDEFLVTLHDLSAEAQEAAIQARLVGEKILDALARPYTFDGRRFRCTASIGATLFHGHDEPVPTLIGHAEMAMHQAKSAGRNAMRFFDPQMQVALDERSAVADELRLAVESRQLSLYFQPQVDGAGRVVGAEALLRWMHPARGVVLPRDFIPLVEETGLILSIGRWVLESACTRLKAWSDDPAMRKLRLAVNVSARQFRQPDFVAGVGAALAAAGADPARLCIELTERLAIEHVGDSMARMRSLKSLGIRLSMDEFGVAFSSLAYLKRMPFDQLKIDPAVVRDLAGNAGDAAVVRAIVALGKTMGLEIIAEGVDSEVQFHCLGYYGCIGFQGYLFAGPMPLPAFEDFVRHKQPHSVGR